jgi:hypothetical protein
MDYYEELGVGRSASVDEIRNSYKRVARLFHPDHCVEASARALAEVQMKRLNAMVATLLDPSERQRYDLGLAAGSRRFDSAVSRPNRSRRRSRGRRNSAAPIWPVCCVILAGALLFVFAKPDNQPQTTTAPLPVVIAKAPSAVGHAAPRPQNARLVVARAKTAGEIHPSDPAPEPPAPSKAVEPEFVTLADTPAQPGSIGAERAAEPVLAGEWLFVPSGRAATDGLYPPEYIELRITETMGVLRGRYRARYRIADRAISPMVAFQFEGDAAPAAGSFEWIGTGNAKGKVSLHLLSNGALEVSWVAEQMGAELGLISGTATLVRKAD